jgi:hypothetical protein
MRLRPDSYVRLGLGPYEDSYFIEVDRGTEGSRAIFGQLERYAAYYHSGHEQAEHGVFPKVLWLTTGDERAAVIAASIGGLPRSLQGLFVVAPFADAPELLLSDTESTSLTRT